MLDYDKAIALDPNYANAYFNRGILYGLANNQSAAIADLAKAASIFKQNDDQESCRSAMELIQELQAEPTTASKS